MNIIPVIDIKDGLVVFAQQGQRETYLPIKSSLCSSSSIEAVINGILTVYPFKTIYIADLNAITHKGSNQYLIDKTIQAFEKIEFWVDKGEHLDSLYLNTYEYYKPIIGSESQNDIKKFQNNNGTLDNYILSLDFFPDVGYSGPIELLEDTTLWPKEIIIMTLDRVGKNIGPGFEKLTYFCEKYPDKNFIAAGGVRNEEDLIKLKKIGVNHALVASALHSGVIGRETIEALSCL